MPQTCLALRADRLYYHSMADKRTRTRRLTQAGFDTTNWTIVLQAADDNLPESHQALEQLCRNYWRPIYSFLRHRGQAGEDAQDLTQGFFLHLLQGRRLRHVHPSKGRLRSFLLAALQNYAENQRDWARAKKRGGGQIAVSMDAIDPVDANDPSVLFDRKWADTLFRRALDQLRERCAQESRVQLFETLRQFLTAESQRGDYHRLAGGLDMSEGALRTAVSRLRAEFRDLLRGEVARTVADSAQIEDELRFLLSLAGSA
jgi:RNA polymerase sigma-70 factor (ECF subfamily)